MDKEKLEEVFKKFDWEEFRRYLYRRYSRPHARHLLSYGRRYGKKVLEDPLLLKTLSYRAARHVLDALGRIQDYLEDYKEVELIVNYRRLRKYFPPKNEKFDLFEWVERGSLIDQAIQQLTFNPLIMSRKTIFKIPAYIAFYTGLRGPEIRYLIINRDRLRSIRHEKVTIVELNYNRVKKKAYLTILPTKLYNVIGGIGYIGRELPKRLREHDVNVSLMRKVHRAILSHTMDEGEIDLLQGRLSRIIVKYYTKHILLIAEKYYEAYRPYYKLLKYIDEDINNQDSIKAGPEGFEPSPSNPPLYLIFFRREGSNV